MIFEKVFNGDGSTFGALYEAKTWLRENGYSAGSPCVFCPQGVVKGKGVYVAKWRNLNQEEIELLDGTLVAGRDRPAVLRLKDPPDGYYDN